MVWKAIFKALDLVTKRSKGVFVPLHPYLEVLSSGLVALSEGLLEEASNFAEGPKTLTAAFCLHRRALPMALAVMERLLLTASP